MRENRNHEGYYDPTAGEAIRKVDRRKKVKSCRKLWNRLTYRIGDLAAFKKLME